MATQTALELAQKYVADLGLAVVPVPFQSKECVFENWQNTRLSQAELPQHFNGSPQNLAAVFGTLSGGVVAVDCDWPEAAKLARQLLPATVAYGRGSDLHSHYLLKSTGQLTVNHKLPRQLVPKDRRSAVIEIISDGHQCLMPGSTHPEGEAVRFAPERRPSNTQVAELDSATLQLWVNRIAGAAVLLYHWPGFEGGRHDLTLALTGACLHGGWTAEDTGKLMSAFFHASQDGESKDRKAAVLSTIAQFQQGANVTGWPTAAELLGDIAPWIADKWQLNADPLQGLIIGPQSIAAAGGHTGQPAVGDWPELLPFEETSGGHIAYPVHAMGSLRPVVESVAAIQQVPIGLAAQCTLAAAATAVQGLFDVATPHANYPVSLFLLSLADTGERKSSTDALLFKPHEDWAQTAVERLSAGTDEESEARLPFMFFESGTVEGLRRMLADHWPSVVATNSDAADFLMGHSMREGRDTATAAFFCKLWDGLLRGHMRGQDKHPITLYGRRLTLSWMIQPQHVGAIVSANNASQGLLSRFLLSYPPSLMGQRKYKLADPAESALLDGYRQRVTDLLNQPLDMNPASGKLAPIPLYLDQPAKQEYARLSDHYESTLADNGLNHSIRESANKAGQQLARLAGVFAAWDGAQSITPERLGQAKVLLDYYLSEWRELQTRLGAIDPETQKAVLLLEWLRGYVQTNPGPFKLKPVYQYGPRKCGRAAKDIKGLVSKLIDRGYVRPVVGNQYELRPVELD